VTDPRTLNPLINLKDETQLRTALTRIARGLDTPMATVVFGEPTAEVANVRSVTMTVVDRHRIAWAGPRWLVALWISDAAGGAVSSASSWSFTKGTLVDEMTPSGFGLVVPDSADGKLTVDITITSAVTRYLNALVLGQVDASDGIAWT